MRPSPLIASNLPPGEAPYDGVPPEIAYLDGCRSDEREWGRVYRSANVLDPYSNLVDNCLSWGFEWRAARPGNSGSESLADDAREIWSAMNWTQTLKGLALHRFFGWSPARVELREVRRQRTGPRRSLIAPVSAVCPLVDNMLATGAATLHPPRWWKVGRDPGELQIRYHARSGIVEQMTEAQWPAYWVVAREGAGFSPYGDSSLALACWAIVRVMSSALARSADSLDGAFGTRVLHVDNLPGGDGAAKIKSIEESLEIAEYFMRRNGWFVELGSTIRSLETGSAGTAGVDFLDRWSSLLRTLITGSTLAQTTQGSGAAGSSGEHARTAERRAYDLGAGIAEAVTDAMLAWLRLNDRDIDANEAPRLVHGYESYVPQSVIDGLHKMKVPLSAERVARAAGGEAAVALIADDAEEYKINDPDAKPAAPFGAPAVPPPGAATGALPPESPPAPVEESPDA